MDAVFVNHQFFQVNERDMQPSSKAAILEMLKARDTVLSGEAMSRRLGISRVAVWKQVKKLQASGYPITATPTGYLLQQAPDTLYPWDLPAWEPLVHHAQETSTTMDLARELARAGCPDFTIVVAERQTAGRGRLKRQWFSPEGGLFFTIVLRPTLPPQLVYRYNFAAALDMAHAVRDVTGVEVRTKWPNDLLVDEDKVCGMLSEMETEADMVSFLNMGLGLNVNNDPPPEVERATSIRRALGKKVPRAALLDAFLSRFHRRLHEEGLDDAIAQWKEISVTIGRRVRVVTRNDTTEGTALDVDDAGALVVRTGEGRTKHIIYGDCFHEMS